jgi:hypothetical protein
MTLAGRFNNWWKIKPTVSSNKYMTRRDNMITQEAIARHEKITGHSLFSPSSMHRIINCPASIGEVLRTPLQARSEYADHGSLLHDIIAKATTQDKIPAETYIKRQLSIEEKDKELLYTCLAYFNSITPDDGHRMLTEQLVRLDTWGLPEVYGTLDKGIVTPYEVDVADWKFGAGVQVYAENNEQLLTYAAGIIGYPNPTCKTVRLHVIQPMLEHFDMWETSYDYLMEWVFGTLVPAIAATKEPSPAYGPGIKQCQFCNAKATCRARYDKNVMNAKEVYTAALKLEEKRPITAQEVAVVLQQSKELKKYISDLEKFAMSELAQGRQMPGFKLIRGRSDRKWVNEAAAAKWLRDYGGLTNIQLYKTKFLSPAQAEALAKSLKKDDDYNKLWDKPPGKLQVAPEDHKSPAVILDDPASAFAEFAGGDDDE